jgi:hypothetical protein
LAEPRFKSHSPACGDDVVEEADTRLAWKEDEALFGQGAEG